MPATFRLVRTDDDPGTFFNWDFFAAATNALPDLLPRDADHAGVVCVIDLPAFTGERRLDIVMDAENDEAIGYLRGE